MTKPRCEDIGFAHLWEDCTPNIALFTHPTQYPLEERRCANCGKHEREHITPRVSEWRESVAGSGQCETLGFEHVWCGPFDIPKEIWQYRRCTNCYRCETRVVETAKPKEWREVTPCE